MKVKEYAPRLSCHCKKEPNYGPFVGNWDQVKSALDSYSVF